MAIGMTRGKRRLGRYVRPILERSGLKADEVAKRSACEAQTITRMLSGRSLPGHQRFLTILAVIGATDAEREHALQLYQFAGETTAVIEHADAPSANYRRFRMDEAEASEERTFDILIVPGPLQTPEYITAMARARRPLLRSADWEQ